jgi:hypothetical protein
MKLHQGTEKELKLQHSPCFLLRGPRKEKRNVIRSSSTDAMADLEAAAT